MVDTTLEKYVLPIEKGLKSLSLKPEPVTLYDPCRYALSSGGKRIRPVLTLLGNGLSGGDPITALPAAIAIELIHNFTLVHDDIMDQAGTRRGRSTVHKRWNESVAILAGDILFVEACKQLVTYGSSELIDSEQYARLTDIYFNAISDVCEGQALDMEFETRDVVRAADYLDMISRKTAALISASMVMGGITAGASDEVLKQLSEIGKSAGMAFQIQDDLLDVIAEPDKFGKVKGGDIREGKKTYLLLLAFERCSDNDRTLLSQLTGENGLDDKDVDRVIALYGKYGVLDAARELLHHYYNRAAEAINTFADSDYKRDLSELINQLKNRDY